MSSLPVYIDPTAEGTGTQLAINDGAPGHSGYVMHASPDLSPPPLKVIYASSIDTEGSIPVGEAGYENRTLGLTVRVYGTTAADLQAKLSALYEKLGKLNREGGTLKLTTAADTEIIFDLLTESSGGATFDEKYLRNNRCDVEMKLTARPFWRMAETSLGTFTQTTLPVLTAVVAGIGGDVRARGRAVVTDTQGADQWLTILAAQSAYYDAAATAALWYPATDLTPTATSTKVAGATGAFGAGSNVVRNTDLTNTYQAILKSEIDSSNLALTHKGSFRVWARIYRPTGNTGAVSAALEWAHGDFGNPTLNDAVAFDVGEYEGQWLFVDLGPVHLRAPSSGAHRWEFRLLAKSTVTGDELDANYFVLFPTAAAGDPPCYIEAAARVKFENPSAFSARDEFDQVVGGGSDPLTGLTLPIGGTWAGAGDTDDFVVEDTGHTAQRATTSDTGERFGLAGVTSYPNIVVQVDFKCSALIGSLHQGVFARYQSTTDFLAAYCWSNPSSGFVVLGGPGGAPATTVERLPLTVDTWYSIRTAVIGTWCWVWLFEQGAPFVGAPVIAARIPAASATGRIGLYDYNFVATACTRNYKNFRAFVPTPDAAIFANQSMTITHKGIEREDPTGTYPSPVSLPRGKYLRLSPGAQEGRSNRLIVKNCRGPEIRQGVVLDPSAADDQTLDLFATPLGAAVP